MLDLEKFKGKRRLTDAERAALIEAINTEAGGDLSLDWDDYTDAGLIKMVEEGRDPVRDPVPIPPPPHTDTPLRLDIGCGKNKKEGFIGVDQYAMEGVDWVVDVTRTSTKINDGKHPVWVFSGDKPATIPESAKWFIVETGGFMLADNSVDEVHCSHFIEHLTATERVRFMNELYRVMKPGAKATLIAPHWCSNRAYGDMTHCWPPVSEMWFYYLSKQWREDQVPHTDKRWNPEGYDCDFEAGWGYSMHQSLLPRNLEFQQDALQFKKEAAQDIIATLTKK